MRFFLKKKSFSCIDLIEFEGMEDNIIAITKMGIEKKNKNKSRKGSGHGRSVTRNPGRCLLRGFTK